jgi:hypothetical protein
MNHHFSYYNKDGKTYVQFLDVWWEVALTMYGNCFIPIESKPSRKVIRNKKDIRNFD